MCNGANPRHYLPCLRPAWLLCRPVSNRPEILVALKFSVRNSVHSVNFQDRIQLLHEVASSAEAMRGLWGLWVVVTNNKEDVVIAQLGWDDLLQEIQ